MRLIVPVPVTVRFVAAFMFQPVVPPTTKVPEPTATVLATVLVADDAPPANVTLYPFASKVPAAITNADAVVRLAVRASCNATDPLGVSVLKPSVNVTPALVIV